jgi:hypothetical protein
VVRAPRIIERGEVDEILDRAPSYARPLVRLDLPREVVVTVGDPAASRALETAERGFSGIGRA